MANEIRQTNEICKQMTAKKLICFSDKLRLAPIERYAQIHARGEMVDGKKAHSLIGVSIFDYSSGKGDATKITRFNLAPEEIQFILTRLEAGFQEYEWSFQKIYGDPDPAKGNTCQAENFRISRHVNDGRGQMLSSPWQIAISNGRGIKLSNKNGGFYMQSGSYREERSGSINLTDMDLYKLLKRVDSYIRVWENSAETYSLITSGKKAYNQMLAASRQNQPMPAPQAPQYSGQQYQYPNQQYQYGYNQNYPQAQANPYNG